jgi:hypothetical protein
MKAAARTEARLRGELLLIASALLLGACETSHEMWIRNRTADSIDVHVEADWNLSISDCVRERFGRAATVDRSVAPATDLCLEGPVVGAGDDYNLFDHVVALRLARNGVTCVEGDGAAVRSRFVRDGDPYVLVVDASVCP